jgi:hypothetical protein
MIPLQAITVLGQRATYTPIISTAGGKQSMETSVGGTDSTVTMRSTPLEMLSPNIARVHLDSYHETIALVEDLLRATDAEPSGVIEDRTGLGKLIEKNSIKSGRMAFLSRQPSDPRAAALLDFIFAQCRAYLGKSGFGNRLGVAHNQGGAVRAIDIEQWWAIDQRAGDYQILHAHIPNLLSGILYLEVPPSMQAATYPDGILTLIETNPFVVLPSPGDMYIWPSYMLHTVYPFRGSGRRLAISFNIREPRPDADGGVYYRPTYVEVRRDQYYDNKPLPPFSIGS